MNWSFKLSASEFTATGTMLSNITTPIWNRLEARPRGEDMTRSLKSEVRDAAWMLCLQWQLGEFAADDAGSPIYSDLQYECAPFDLDEHTPLEAKIESQAIFPSNYPELRNLNIRLQMGSYWLRLLADASDLKHFKDNFLQKQELQFPEATPGTTADVLQFLELYKGRSIDGYKFLNFYSTKSRFDEFGNKASRLVALYDKFTAWYNRTYLQPQQEQNTAWNASRLEYSFESTATTTAQTKTVVAEEYYNGHLDWYNFSLRNTAPANAANTSKVQKREYSSTSANTKRLLPSPVKYAGMPEARFWAFEDGATNLAAVDVDRNNIGKLALIEFGLIYSNDWSVVPVDVPVGCFADVKNLTIVDSFGKTTVIPPVSDNNTGDMEWKFFALNKINAGSNEPQDNSLLIPQTMIKAQQSRPVEEIVFMRDEMANMVWGIESIVPAPLGNGRPGSELNTDKPAKETGNKLWHVERTDVPVQWIPFVPVKNSQSRLVLRRGKLVDETGKTIRPNTGLLRMGLDKNDVLARGANGKAITYDIEENEVPRDGITVTKTYQRTRWTNGEVYVWLGMQKSVGKREGMSGLMFDQLVPGK